MNLKERLDFSEVKSNPIEELRTSEYPVLVYGGGSFARDILHVLKQNEIRAEGVFVDDGGFVLPDIFEDYKVRQFPIDKIDFPCYVVMGMANYLKGRELKNENIKKVFYISFYPYGDQRTSTEETVRENMDDYQAVYDLLADNLSRDCMVSYLNARIKNDAGCVFPCYEREQTYFENTVFRVKEGENYVDIGAYTGDTIRLFFDACNGKPGKIWAFEGDRSLEGTIRSTIKELEIEDRTELFITGLWSGRKTLFFSKAEHNMEEGTVTNDSTGLSIEVDTVDHILRNRQGKVDMLKINFANADKALRGCMRIIAEDRPKLAVVVGFFDSLICDIPGIVREADASYKIFFRYNSAIPAKLVMYAVPK